MQGVKATFSAQLMTNNIRVTMFAMALGMTWGAGTLMLLFWNGVILGAVMLDYIAGGQAVFLAGWLLPHGSVEIPAILLGGQAGLILAGALIGWGVAGDARRTPARRYARSLRDRRRRRGAARVGRNGGGVRLAIPPAGHSVRPEDRVRSLRNGRARGLFGMGGTRMSGARQSTLTIETPEGVIWAFDLATPVTRALAWSVDAAGIAALTYFIGETLAGTRHVESRTGPRRYRWRVYLLASMGYAIVLEWRWRGQTVGKRLLRLRVIDADGLQLRFAQIVLRNLIRAVDMLPLTYLVGGVSALVTSDGQRLGDIAANTVVVRERGTRGAGLRADRRGTLQLAARSPDLGGAVAEPDRSRSRRDGTPGPRRRDGFGPAARVEVFRELGGLLPRARAVPEIGARRIDG